MKDKALTLFIFASGSEVFSHIFGIPDLHHIAKPLIMPALGWYFFLSVPWNMNTAMVLGGVLFSFLGDSFLMYDHINELYFMLGLGSFLLAHIFYAIAYGRHVDDAGNDSLANVQIIRMSVPVIMAGTGLIAILYPGLGELKLPVIAYALVLMFMVLKAIMRFKKTPTPSFLYVFAGAVLFMISDSLLAINKFLTPLPWVGVLVMSTYILAQAFIVRGLIIHTRSFVQQT